MNLGMFKSHDYMRAAGGEVTGINAVLNHRSCALNSPWKGFSYCRLDSGR